MFLNQRYISSTINFARAVKQTVHSTMILDINQNLIGLRQFDLNQFRIVEERTKYNRNV